MKHKRAADDSAGEKKKKPEKEKIIYIDDNSTIADMSNTRQGRGAPKQNSTFKEKMRTYFSVVKRMLLPMIVTLAAFTLAYLLMTLLLK